jgi:hypothetical protein
MNVVVLFSVLRVRESRNQRRSCQEEIARRLSANETLVALDVAKSRSNLKRKSSYLRFSA